MTSIERRVLAYIEANYDIPKDMTFCVDHAETDLLDWIEEYIAEYNENVDCPFDDESDESDVEAIGEEILQMMTSSPVCQSGRCAIRFC